MPLLFHIPIKFSTIELQSGNIVFSYLVEEARESACNSAKRIAKTSSGSYAEQIWALITSGKYRRSSLSYPQEVYDEIIESIETSINERKPIELVFSFFPSEFGEISRKILQPSVASACRFIAINQVVGIEEPHKQLFRNSIRCTVHPKVRQLGIHLSINLLMYSHIVVKE